MNKSIYLKRTCYLTLLIFFSVNVIPSIAQNVNYHGQVSNKKTGEPLNFVSIKFRKKGTITNAKGEFQISIEKTTSKDMLQIS